MRSSTLIIMAALALGGLSPGQARAGTILCDFTGDPSTNGFTLTSGFGGGGAWIATGGNPGGYVQLTDAVDGESSALLLPDFDNGKIISGFTVSMDVRVGAGTERLPAEGWSINFVPPLAKVVTNGVAGPGWASDFSSTPVPNLPERGSIEGLGVYALTFDHGGGDILGFNARYNQVQFALGGWTLPPTGPKDYDGDCTDIYSLQTGPTNSSGVAALCWANFTMTMHEGGLLDIYWKGSPVVTNFATGWTPQAGRWILAARTSSDSTVAPAAPTGGNEVHEFDNISITTTLATTPILAKFSGGPTGFGYDLEDLPAAMVNTSTVKLTLDGTNVTPTLVSKVSTNTTILYNQLLGVGSHKATLSYNTATGVNVTSTNSFAVLAYAYTTIPASYAVTGVDTTKAGFKIRPYQTAAPQPGDLTWTEGQLAGVNGPNIANLWGADAQGYFYQTDVINYNIYTTPEGHFVPPEYTQNPAPGIPGNLPEGAQTTGNFTEEILAWLYFPAAGAFQMGVTSDDGFKVTTSTLDISDPNGLLLGEYNGDRGSGDTLFNIVIPAPGYYPFRLVWFNGNGELPNNAASCEWFIQQQDGSYVLINDVSTPGAIRAYYSGPAGLPFVQYFNGTIQGFSYVLLNGATAVANNSIQTTLNGAPVKPTVTQIAGVTTLTYSPASPLPSPSTNVVVLSFANNATPPVTQTLTNTFVVSGLVIPQGIALTTGVDTTQPGFAVRIYQTTAAQPGNLWWTEEQLAGLEGTNIADLSVANNGWYTNNMWINYDVSSGDGNFTANNGYPDMYFPGLPGTTSSTDNSSAEILAWVNFPAAGTYSMGVCSDDGFKVTLGKNPRDQFAPLLGYFDGGRGFANTIFQFYIPTPGFYPMRLVWFNGTGGANLKWFTVNPDGTFVLVNDTSNPTALKAYCAGPLATQAYVSLLNPYQGDLNASPTSPIYIQFTDGSTQVDATSIGLSLNGQTLAPSVDKTGGITTVQQPMPFLPSGSTNVAVLVYKEVGNSVPITNTWQFVLGTYLSLPPSLRSPIGSGVASEPGFRYRVDQIPQGNNASELSDSVEVAEQIVAGLWGVNASLTSSNVANVSTFLDNGYLDLTTVVNMSGGNGGADLGFFTSADGYPDSAPPGIPGTISGYVDQFAAEFLTYVEFPAAGIYTMGVASDDCFRVTPIETNSFLGTTLYVNAPSVLSGLRIPGVPTLSSDGGFGPEFPDIPITAQVVYADPNTACSGSASPAPPDNAAALAGNIAMVDRGVCEFGWKALAVQEAGAIAVIEVQNRTDLPITLGAGTYGGQVTIPTMMISQNDGATLKAHLADPGGVWVTVGHYPGTILGQFDSYAGRGTTETTFSFGVGQPGVYPLRLVWNNGGGAYSCEWYTLDASGNRTLVNDTVAGALKAYRARVVATPPALSIAHVGPNVVITFDGTLQSATNVQGPYTDVMVATSPYTVPAPTGAAMFFRAHR